MSEELKNKIELFAVLFTVVFMCWQMYIGNALRYQADEHHKVKAQIEYEKLTQDWKKHIDNLIVTPTTEKTENE